MGRVSEARGKMAPEQSRFLTGRSCCRCMHPPGCGPREAHAWAALLPGAERHWGALCTFSTCPMAPPRQPLTPGWERAAASAPMPPCRPAAGDAPASRSLRTQAAEQKRDMCGQLPILLPSRPSPQTHVHEAPSAEHDDSPVITGHPRSGPGSCLGLCGFWASASGLSDGSPPRRQHAQRGGRLHEGDPGCRSARVSKPARSCPGGAQASVQCPLCCHHWSSCSFLRLLPLSHAGAWSRQLCTPHSRRGTENPAQVRECGPGHTQQDQVAGLGEYLPEKSFLEPEGVLEETAFLTHKSI